MATTTDYDRHFALDRGELGLVEWTRSCLQALEAQRQDLRASSLSDEDKLCIADGMCVVLQLTLERWVRDGVRP